jgi:hypothetical protein
VNKSARKQERKGTGIRKEKKSRRREAELLGRKNEGVGGQAGYPQGGSRIYPKKKRLMEIEDLEKELAEAGWVFKLENDALVITDKLLDEIEETSQKMDGNVKKRIERRGGSVGQLLAAARGTSPEPGSKSPGRPALSTFSTLFILGMISIVENPRNTFMAYEWTQWSNIVESYLLLEPDKIAALDRNGKFKTTVYGEIVQMKMDGSYLSSDVR